MLRIAVVGASGRMGRAVVRLAHQAGDAVVFAVGAADVGGDVGELAGIGRLGVAVQSDLAGMGDAGPDAVIDFSSPELTLRLLDEAARAKLAVVSGTTGLDAAATRALDRAAGDAAVLWEPNMSVGVRVLADLVQRAALALGPAFDIEIVEAHHRQKIDAPSGTALRLAEAARTPRADASVLVHGRQGNVGARPRSEIGMHAVRGGDVIGEHIVHFLGDGERVELVHRATSRDVFAHGALRCARWIARKRPGRYTLDDVLAGVIDHQLK